MYSVVTNCTAEKLGVAAPARELYRGPSVRRIAKVVDEARAAGIPAALYIISARYGLVREDEVLEPYDETLSGRSPEEIKSWARAVGLLDAVDKLAERSTVVVVASKPYYTAVEEVVCRRGLYVLAPYRACGRWIKTGNFNKHIALRSLLMSLSDGGSPPSHEESRNLRRRRV
ncbi:DUF6884 domain-containing protein [Pyrobaculum neutrophilum]|uniref:DUF6884 domain-containing protein n=1 Tax=Pyrobaculum neutrophilum (strain DSM 2338 / JCM 9278 / NBRC 100436 / V24Sta) TaxID=444157 RepID=B1YBK8_PYRNV|nr:DUF6884 domain-containing protein [Pyrobaculum neutrophilum]ACB40810.1 conserved hypothetical protein [Pyrobaculum neutrophilum V24Sta]